MSPPESSAERTQELPRLDRVAEADRMEVQHRAALLGDLHHLRRDLSADHAVHVYDIWDAASSWSGHGGCRRADRDRVAMSAADLRELGRTMTPAHARVVEEALRLAELVAAVVQPLGYTSQDRVI